MTVTFVPQYLLMKRRNGSSGMPLDFEDTRPEYHQQEDDSSAASSMVFETLPKPNEFVATMLKLPTQPIDESPEPLRLDPTIQVAQDNLNYKLWHKLLWLIPNTTWIQTQHQSLAEVQWLCLGPDYYYFTAQAELCGAEWIWSFTKA